MKKALVKETMRDRKRTKYQRECHIVGNEDFRNTRTKSTETTMDVSAVTSRKSQSALSDRGKPYHATESISSRVAAKLKNAKRGLPIHRKPANAEPITVMRIVDARPLGLPDLMEISVK